jgi:hypothetical protein
LADSPFSWAHIVILAIDAAGHGVDTTWAPVDPYGPFETAFEQFPDGMAQEVVSGVWLARSVSPPDLPKCLAKTWTFEGPLPTKYSLGGSFCIPGRRSRF